MKNKIIFYSVSFLLALCIKPVVGFMTEARDCKSELQNLKIIEENDLKIHTKKIELLKNTLKNAKNKQKIDYNFNNNLDNDFLLEELK